MPTKVTIPEGASVREVAYIFADTLPSFDAEKFIEIAKEDEGYLFPDTYLFASNVKPYQVYREMRKTFDRYTGSLETGNH